jgi:phosphoglycolate phosphatase-like HAD superfamily hydrolase
MQHRHLNHEGYTLAAIDDLIGRGGRQDWAELRRAALADRVVMEKVLRIASARYEDPYAQRYRFWRRYAEQHLTAA